MKAITVEQLIEKLQSVPAGSKTYPFSHPIKLRTPSGEKIMINPWSNEDDEKLTWEECEELDNELPRSAFH